MTDKKKATTSGESAAAKGAEEDWETELTNELDDFEVRHERERRRVHLPGTCRCARRGTGEGPSCLSRLDFCANTLLRLCRLVPAQQVEDDDLDNMEFDGTAEDLERELQDMLAEED